MSSAAALHAIAVLRAEGATVLDTPCGTLVALPRAVTLDPADHIALEEARVLAKLRTTRPLRDAIRARELPAYGTQRTRTVKRGDLLAWIESRRSKPSAGADDADIDARIARMRRNRHP